ncbi:MAG TPA: SNF2-related protein [Symbiobacteriaceae bacterium]|nr:SNF2-related protein [Symbiobacteriaceae bacterium]
MHPNWFPPLLLGLPSAAVVTLPILLPGPRSWKPTKVAGYRLSLPDGVCFLQGMAERFARDVRLAPAPSLLALRDLAVFLLAGLAEGKAVPLLRAEAGVWSARWTPILTGTEARIEALTAALPDIARAVVPPGRAPRTFRPLPAPALVQRFLSAGTEALARSFLKEAERPARGLTRNANQAWVEGLVGAPDLPPGLSDAGILVGAVGRWTDPLQPVRGPEALQTGLRLSPPRKQFVVDEELDEDLDEDEEPEEGQPPWLLSLTVHTGGLEPIVRPAFDVWASLGEEIFLGEGRYLGAEERILADLPQLGRIFPPLSALRGEQDPTHLHLDEAQVIDFLQHGAPALRSAGFLVQVEKGLLRTEQPTVTMHLRPKGQERMGLHQLIEVDWEIALGGIPVSFAELEALAEAQSALFKLGDRWVQVDKKAVAKVLKKIKPHQEKIALGEAVRLVDQVESATAEGWVKEMLDRLKEPAKIEPLPAPDGLNGTLRAYQQRGFEWLAFLRRYGFGACLADDMGLGKTIQLITLMLWERQVLGVTAPNLLVCPVSLVGNWQRELARFAPSLRVMLHHGDRRLEGESFAAEALKHDVVITTYSLIARDESDLTAVEWNGVVADEAQALKNPGTQHAGAINRINSGYRIALTGTPLENQVFDVWALFQFLNPGLLGTKSEFRKLWKKDEEAMEKVRRRIRPFIMRRVKSDPSVAGELPPKIENRVTTTMTMEQAALYEATARRMLETVPLIKDDFTRSRVVLSGLTRLKLICNHPGALLNDGGPLEGRSGKLDRLTEMLEEVIAEDDRALIFTQFPGFGRRLVDYWSERFGQPVLFLDGSTPRSERERLIAQFQGGEAPIFLLSLKAAGVGLNLTAANHVFHFDRWWNPAVEEQATDRAYRIGQTRQVMVHKLMTAGTLEEKIDKILGEKRTLAAEVLATGDSWVKGLSTAQLRSLINLEGE